MKVNKIFVAFAVLLVCVLGYGFFSSKKGEDTKNMPIVLANEGVIYLNEAKAKQLGIEIPNVVKEKAKVVDKK